jgi:hypothetical protein
MPRKITTDKAIKISTKIKSLLTRNKPNLNEIIEIEKIKNFPYLYITHSRITLENYINAKSLIPIFESTSHINGGILIVSLRSRILHEQRGPEAFEFSAM